MKAVFKVKIVKLIVLAVFTLSTVSFSVIAQANSYNYDLQMGVLRYKTLYGPAGTLPVQLLNPVQTTYSPRPTGNPRHDGWGTKWKIPVAGGAFHEVGHWYYLWELNWEPLPPPNAEPPIPPLPPIYINAPTYNYDTDKCLNKINYIFISDLVQHFF
jgi:hypothetical protein